MPSTVDFTGLDRLSARLRRIAHPDATPLMKTWTDIIETDNRRGIMVGWDKDAVPMAPVTYRPLKYSSIKALSPSKKQRGGLRTNARAGAYNPGIGGNLTSAEYRRLGGPPLAPRGQFSRVITNLKTRFGKMADGKWEAVGYWDNVVSKKGVRFLMAHFTGANRLPRRDLRGVRPQGWLELRSSLRAWMIDTIRSAA